MQISNVLKKYLLVTLMGVLAIAAGLLFVLNKYKMKASTNEGVYIQGTPAPQIVDRTVSKVAMKYNVLSPYAVSISIADKNGKQVKLLYRTQNNVTPGIYSNVEWDLKDGKGRLVPDGYYQAVFVARKARTNLIVEKNIKQILITKSTAISLTADPVVLNPTNKNSNISFVIPENGIYSLTAQNQNEVEVRSIANATSFNAGPAAKVWDGKDAAGSTVADGTYTITLAQRINGGNVTRGTATISIQNTTNGGDTSATAEYGNTIEGTFSANYNWFATAGNKFGISFTADKSGPLGGFNIQWKSGSSYGYGAGNTASGHTVSYAKSQHGVYKFEIFNNGNDNFPAGTAISSVENIYPEDAMSLASGRTVTNPDTEICNCDGSMQINLTNQPALEEGKIYHLVITNQSENPAANWSSPNTLQTRINTGTYLGGENNAENFQDGRWTPWVSQHNLYQPNPSAKVNNLDGSHAPILLRWADGSYSGDPYYSAASQNRHPALYGTNKAGESILWKESNTSISKIGITVFKERTKTSTSEILTNENVPAPAGDLTYHLQLPDGTIKSGILARGSEMTVKPEWKYAAITPVTFETGKTYKLWFDSPNSISAAWYGHDPVYGQGLPALWLNYTWGGTESYYYNEARSYTDMDLTFSLEK